MSSMIRPRRRLGIGTSVKRLNVGAMDLPLLTRTSFASQVGSGMPSYGDPPMSTNVGLSIGVEAGTVTPDGTPFVPSPTSAG